MTDDDELDDRLRRLFADDGLILSVAEDAERAVVTGARRRRRRKLSAAAAGGMVAVAGLVFAAAALVGVGRPTGGVLAASRPPVSSPTLTTSPEPTTTAPPTSTNELGPFGADGVWLGMPERTALRLAVSKAPLPGKSYDMPGCVGYELFVPSALPSGAVRPSAVSSVPVDKSGLITVVVSPDAGVVELGGVTTLRTPEGIGLGMPSKLVYTRYAKVAANSPKVPSMLLTGVPGNNAASYVFDVDGTGVVRSIWLRVEGDPHCR